LLAQTPGYSPALMLVSCFLIFMRWLAQLPLPAVRSLGALLGFVLYLTARRRRQIVMINLQRCFPHWPAQQRQRVAREHFKRLAQSMLDASWLWHAPREVVARRLSLVDPDKLLQQKQPTIFFAPHFVGIDAGGAVLSMQPDLPLASIYVRQRHAKMDAWMKTGRERWGQVNMISRLQGVRPIIAALRAGQSLHLSPDMDFGREDSVFAPFFGQNAATITSLSRLAGLGKARVLPILVTLTREGYSVRILPPWPDYPSGDAAHDAARMNAELEPLILQQPEQYYWVHKRFKTRPVGEAGYY
jgi:Kdo2-lipid IVA lauroyltransferase/acyltransferase